jgi:hypothetical protein
MVRSRSKENILFSEMVNLFSGYFFACVGTAATLNTELQSLFFWYANAR